MEVCAAEQKLAAGKSSQRHAVHRRPGECSKVPGHQSGFGSQSARLEIADAHARSGDKSDHLRLLSVLRGDRDALGKATMI